MVIARHLGSLPLSQLPPPPPLLLLRAVAKMSKLFGTGAAATLL
jgi:hypothetical protein